MALVLALIGGTSLLPESSGGGADDSARPAPRGLHDRTNPPESPPDHERDPGVRVATVLAAIEKRGFACYDSFERSAAVDRCFLDPAVGDEQTVTVVSEQGTVTRLAAAIDLEDARSSRRGYAAVVHGLEGSLLSGREGRTLLSARASERSFRTGWGTASQIRHTRGGSAELVLVAHGERTSAIPTPRRAASSAHTRKVLDKHGFACERRHGDLSCTAERRGIRYRAADPGCGKRQRERDRCEDLPLRLTASAAANTKATRERIARFFDAGVRAAGGRSPGATRRWVATHLDADPHLADVGGLFLEVEAGRAGADRTALTLTVSGIDLGDLARATVNDSARRHGSPGRR